jgi:hypothetical protein
MTSISFLLLSIFVLAMFSRFSIFVVRALKHSALAFRISFHPKRWTKHGDSPAALSWHRSRIFSPSPNSPPELFPFLHLELLFPPGSQDASSARNLFSSVVSCLRCCLLLDTHTVGGRGRGRGRGEREGERESEERWREGGEREAARGSEQVRERDRRE